MRASWVVVVWLTLVLIAACGDPARKLESLEVSLQAPRPGLLVTRTQQAVAIGTYSDGTTEDLTQGVTWSSSNTGVATVNATGLVMGVTAGTIMLTAETKGISDDLQIVIDPNVLTAIDITGPGTSVPDGLFLQLTATGTFTDGTTLDITDDVTWTSDMTSIATIDPMGEVEGKAVGGVTIRAAKDGVSDTYAISVTAGVLVSITVTPDNDTRPKGRTVQYTATGHFSDGVDNDITAQASWTSSAPAIASVNDTTAKGRVTYGAVGSATITAAMGGQSDGTVLTVIDAVIDSIQISPAVPLPLPKGLDQQFTCLATLSDGTTDDCTDDCVWESSLPNLVSIDSVGLATAGNTLGTTTISCDVLTFTDDVDLTVTNAVLTDIDVSPDDLDIPIGVPIEYRATGTFSDGTSSDITNTVAWTSTPSNFLAITPLGVATSQPGTVAGPCTVTATLGVINDVANCDLTAGTLTSIDITPNDFSFPVGLTQQYTANGNFSAGPDFDITQFATWSSTNTAFATVNDTTSKGLVTTVAVGTSSITATYLTVTGSTQIHVDPPPAPEIQFLLTGSPFGSGGIDNLGGGLSVGAAIPFSFTIQNLGNANLTLGTSTFTTQTGCTGAFTTPAPMSPLAPNATTTLTGTVTPTATGSFTCTFGTPNNDTSGSENPYVVEIRGSTGGPSIVLSDSLGVLLPGDVVPVGSRQTGISFTVPITVQNAGTTPLSISTVAVGQTDHCSGSITTPPASSVGPSSSTSFVATLTPVNSLGLPFACELVVTSNDPNNPTFNVDVFGTGSANLGNFGDRDGTWTGDGNCDLFSLDLDTGPQILSPNFPANPNTVFTLTGPNTASAGSNLTVFGQPGHTCVITLPNGTQIRIDCSNAGGGFCSELFNRAPQPEIRVVDFNSNFEIFDGGTVYLDKFLGRDTYDGLISNVGLGNLNIGAITAGPGQNCTINQVIQVSPSTIAPGATRGFGIDFTVNMFPWECVVNIPSNDPDEPMTTLHITHSPFAN